MSESKGLSDKYRRLVWFIAALAAIVYLIVQNINTVGNILLVAIGFGAVILIHEFGHFLFAKLAGIKVEAFSIGFPPILAGIQKTEKGFRIRVLPQLFPSEDGSGDGAFSFTLGRQGKAGETEYRIGLVPVGGFVKMLGQDDVGSVKTTDDPRSYVNKSVGARISVIAAGVTFNVISAVIIFMTVFLIGINLTPPIVGGVIPDSPAARAGIRAGDEVTAIAGKSKDLDFSSIKMAAALSDNGEKIALKIKHEDGSVEDFAIAAEEMPGAQMKVFGIEVPMSLAIAKVSDANALLEEIGLLPGDRIKAVNGRKVDTYWEMEKVVGDVFTSAVTLSAERTNENGNTELLEVQIPLRLGFTNKYEVKTDSDLSHICFMVPRLQITAVLNETDVNDSESSLQTGDIILAVGNVENPTYKEMREVTEAHKDKELALKVLRADDAGIEKEVAVAVVPKRSVKSGKVLIGIAVALDAEHPIVAKTISVEGDPEALAIPAGAEITAVDDVKVSSFYDISREIRRNAGRHVTIHYRLGSKTSGGVGVEIGDAEKFVTAKGMLAEFVPFEPLERLYKAGGPLDAVGMGYRKTIMFVAQTYVTLKQLVSGLVSTKELMGPVGIITFSYQIVAEQPIIYYAYFLGLISACIAVFNFLPLPPLDGGHIVLLMVEKIKGSALSERVQAAIAYAGWAIIGSFFLYVTFNDIVKGLFS